MATSYKSEKTKDIADEFRKHGYLVTVFSSKQRLPSSFKGLPDLFLMKDGVGIFAEVKLSYANYMRDQMHDAQWQWYHDRRDHWGKYLRYAIIGSAEELLTYLSLNYNDYQEPTFISEYHWGRYEQWRRGR
jgi:hypothetical protein